MHGKNKIREQARNKILKEVVAFANDYAGTLLLALRESNSSSSVAGKIIPLPRCSELAERLRKQFRACIEPQIPQLGISGAKTNGEEGVVYGLSGPFPHGASRVSLTLSP